MVVQNEYARALYAAFSIIYKGQKPPASLPECRKMVGDALIEAQAQALEPELLSLTDIILETEREAKPPPQSISNLRGVEYIQNDIAVWRGDITTLKVDAIVNAANEAGEGCYVASHRCIDNVIHRASGPRLRKSCNTLMSTRITSLSPGSTPLVTPGHNLPSSKVIHVTGPCIPHASLPTPLQFSQLKNCYVGVLDTCKENGLRTVAFCSISTGLFNFPSPSAASVAVSAVRGWLVDNPGVMDLVLFDVFTSQDWDCYLKERSIDVAKGWVQTADCVLVIAGAGMSGYPKDSMRNVYVDEGSFQRQYPDVVEKYGYMTAYETMGLVADPTVREIDKWGYWSRHYNNLRNAWEPNEGYKALREIVGDKNYAVLTSNVDGCFERSGFERSRVYTPQGDCGNVQCVKPCRKDAVYRGDEEMRRIRGGGKTPPKCKYCGGKVCVNLRMGGNFLHSPYDDGADNFVEWTEWALREGKKIVIIEVGAGFNTPTVTRFPGEAIVREAGDNGAYIRINPAGGRESDAPGGIKRSVGFREGWEFLDTLNHAVGGVKGEGGWSLERSDGGGDFVEVYNQHFGHWDWRRFVGSLKR